MNERQKKIMVPYEETTDICPDCSNIPCDCGMPAGYAPTPTPWTDANEEDGWNPCGWAVDSNLVRELERELIAARQELTAVTEQRDEARELAARWESSSDAMVRAGAEQARRADENREWALKSIRERDEAREQRDRLADAIRKHKFCDVELYEALQSLNKNKP